MIDPNCNKQNQDPSSAIATTTTQIEEKNNKNSKEKA